MKGCYLFICLSAFVIALTVTVIVHHHYYHHDQDSSESSVSNKVEELLLDRPDLGGIRANALMAMDTRKVQRGCAPECYKISDSECRCPSKSTMDY